MFGKILSTAIAGLLCAGVLTACDPVEAVTTISETVAATTVVAEVTTAAETSAAEVTSVQEQTGAEEVKNEEAAEAQKKADVVKQFTLEMDEETADFYWHNTFIQLYMAPMMHWDPMLFFTQWSDMFEVHELELLYNDPVYGEIELCFTGSRVHDIFMSDIYFRHYPDCMITEKDGTEHSFRKSEIEDQEIYIVGLCEGLPFGMPIDGGTGPFWAIEVKDGKANVIARNVVMLKCSLPKAENLSTID